MQSIAHSMGSDMLVIDMTDSIVKCLAESVVAVEIDSWRQLSNYELSVPVIFRSMSQRNTVSECNATGRDYFYIDTGYLGNLDKRKNWHRVVHNGMQHSSPNYNLLDDRFNKLAYDKLYIPFSKWKKDGRAILIVTPSEKPCQFYGINRDEWVASTISSIKAHTDRPIIIRDKVLRRDRVGVNNIYQQFKEDDIYAVVTYNSIAATESIGYGIPCFTSAPNAADPFCLKDISKIETPYYSDVDQVKKWQHWLAYCQFTTTELCDGTAFNIINEYNIK